MTGAWEKSLDKVLLKFGVTKETLQENAAEELESTLQDYHDLAKQYSDMLSRFGYEDKPVKKNGVWLCPSCHNRAIPNEGDAGAFPGRTTAWGHRPDKRRTS